MSWLRAHRVILTVYGAVIALAVFEVTDPEIRTGQPDKPEVYLTPDSNIADVSAEVFPDRAMTLYYRAQQAALCDGVAPDADTACRERGPVESGEIRALHERALATGNRSIELLMYNYAMVLLQEGAPADEIDAAIRNWRSSHPGAGRPDPRVAYREMTDRRGRGSR